MAQPLKSEARVETPRRDIVVVGASMGGVGALQRLVEALPSDFPAALVVVQHTSAEGESYLGRILDRAGALPASLIEDQERIEPGHIYVAPPAHHALLFNNEAQDSYARLSTGPRENRQRPAIDALFRSAAVSHGRRVVGVVLTGLLDDGAAGLAAIKRLGGVALVQDPEDADWPDMPRSALMALAAVGHEPDVVASLASLARIIDSTCRKSLDEQREGANVNDSEFEELRQEVRIAAGCLADIETAQTLGEPAPYVCPDCGGPLWQQHDTSVRRYRCHTGHGHTAKSVLGGQDEAVERSLWVAVRTLEERARMLTTMAKDAEDRGRPRTAESLRLRAKESEADAGNLRRMVFDWPDEEKAAS